MNAVLLVKYIKWHLLDAPLGLAKGWGNILWFNYNYFSIGLLLKTYFAPWRRITWDYGRGFDIGRYLFIFSSNVISRVLGAVMRSFLILAGLFLQALLCFAALATLALWLALPLLIVFSFFYGVILLF
ncbi:MAG TPA: hypothetical protein VGA53_01630 [Candidatus Paceibacterota bacterium]